ncbi:unnamed protein product [Caenorhabditis bovis]|uniref:NR LBD domain-containing protein n=1 Tax=Caenorhabditis bovis TaxID=2654633 RepID=A0A8S1EIN7_9PELO|nr:unnamed protein product [Caenorhabditis bovis]
MQSMRCILPSHGSTGSCRYQRCIREGMVITDVQLKRDQIGRRARNKKLSTSMDDDGLPSANDYVTDFPFREFLSSTVIIERMKKGYEQFMSMRRATNKFLKKNNVTSYFQTESEELEVSRFDVAMKVGQIETHLVTDVVNTYFFPFNHVKYEDKLALFKNFFCYFSHTDRAYQSYKHFMYDENNDKILMPDGGFIKKSELEKFYEQAEGVHKPPKDAATIFQPVFDYILDVIVGYMRSMKLVDFEYMALLGFCLWDNDIVGISEEARKIAEGTQAKMLNELHSYYESEKCVTMLRENSVLAEMFDFYEADVCCKNFKNEQPVDLNCPSSCIAHTAKAPKNV